MGWTVLATLRGVVVFCTNPWNFESFKNSWNLFLTYYMPYLYTKPINLWNVTKINFCYYNYFHCYATFEINVAGKRFPSIKQYTERPQEKHLKPFIERNMFASGCLRSSTNKGKETLRKKGSLGRWPGKRFLYGRRLILASISTFFDSLNCILSMFFFRKKNMKTGLLET